jgi:hypothetical protein
MCSPLTLARWLKTECEAGLRVKYSNIILESEQLHVYRYIERPVLLLLYGHAVGSK